MSNVFISYVRDDQNAVDLLTAELRREGIHVWLDREDICPGQFWEDALKDAIRQGSFFLACFSEAFNNRHDTYMNDEIRIACEETRSQNQYSGWIIPLMLSKCNIPDIEIVAGRNLKDIQWIDLSNDWNSGIWKLLQVVRPPSEQSNAIDLWFRELCEIHIRSKIDRSWSMGAFRVRQIEDAWRSLLLPSRWAPILDLTVRLFEKVKMRKVPLTERWVEPSNTGVTILVTVSPTPSVDKILETFPNIDSDADNFYESFIRSERKRIHNLVNWPHRDLAHLIFAMDGDDVKVDFLYWPNLSLMLKVYGLSIKRQREGQQTGPIEMMYPGSILTATEFEKIWIDVMRDEAGLLEQQHHLVESVPPL